MESRVHKTKHTLICILVAAFCAFMWPMFFCGRVQSGKELLDTYQSDLDANVNANEVLVWATNILQCSGNYADLLLKLEQRMPVGLKKMATIPPPVLFETLDGGSDVCVLLYWRTHEGTRCMRIGRPESKNLKNGLSRCREWMPGIVIYYDSDD